MSSVPARRGDDVDDFHGTKVPDPYRWLEDVGSSETQAWIDAQQAATEAVLATASKRDALRTRLAELLSAPRAQAPWRRGSRWFQLRNDGKQDHDVLYTMESPEDTGRVLIDPNTLSEDHSVALVGMVESPDGSKVAWASTTAGSSWQTWRVRDVASGRDDEDVLEWAKIGLAWAPDSSGVYYGCFDEVADGEVFERPTLNQKVRFHRLGTTQLDDTLTYERPDHPAWLLIASVTEDGRYLVIDAAEGASSINRIYYRDLTNDGDAAGFVELFGAGDGMYRFIGNEGERWLFQTDKNAPRGRIVSVDINDAAEDRWTTVIAERDEALPAYALAANYVRGRLLVIHQQDVMHRLAIHNADGSNGHAIALPVEGSVAFAHTNRDDDRVFITLTTFAAPPMVLEVDLDSATTATFWESSVASTAGLLVEQVLVDSSGGARVPMYLVRNEGVTASGDVPTLMNGYGGFGVSWTPDFMHWTLSRVWLELGGMLGWTILRGGGEYGQEWHDAGRLANKQNVFDDFIACGEWLIANGWTRRDRLAITGMSNGGLLVGACMTQRPDLYGACVPQVGVLDMLHYHEWTSGRWWVGDYGSAENPDEFAYLYAYSPVHNVRDGVRYPPTMVMAGAHDDHVVPGHSFKFAAALQHAQDAPEPILIRIETKTGHGGGKPTAMQVAERADMLAFFTLALSMG
jgi:prolyl oligopeptidase